MKRILLFLILLPIVANANIVNNSGTTPADSISIPFYALDSTGDVTVMASGDYVILTVFYPSGAEAYQDSIAYDNAKITSSAIDAAGYNGTMYSYKAPVADIDGTPVQGLYSYVLLVVDESSAAIGTPHRGHFNLLTETDFNTSVEYIKDVLDTLQNHDNWVATTAKQTLIIDTVNGVMDTLQTQDDWIAKAAELVKAIDSINGLLDTLQLWDTRIDSMEAALADVSIGDKVWTDAATRTITGTGTDAITATSIAAAAIGSSELGGDAITSSELAATAVQEIWEYAARTLTDSVLVDMSGFDGALDNDTTLVAFLRATITKLGNILDSLQAQDNWVAKEASLFDPATDSVLIDVSSNVIYADTIANRVLEDSSHYQGAAGSLDSTTVANIVKYYVWRNIDSTHADTSGLGVWLVNNLSGGSSLTDESIAQAIMDSVRNEATSDTTTASLWADIVRWLDGASTYNPLSDSVLIKNLGQIAARNADSAYAQFTEGSNEDAFKADVSALALEASITAIRDSLQYCVTANVSALATALELAKAIDSINAILDTLQVYDTRLALEASVDAIRDSVQYLVTATGFSTYDPTTDSTLIDMSAFNAALDNDTSLVNFLRAAASGGSASITDADMAAIIDTFYTRVAADTVSGALWSDVVRRVRSYLDAAVSGVSGGSGAYAVLVYAVDTSGTDDTLSGVSVTVQNNTGVAVTSPQTTNTSGYATFNLDGGLYRFLANASPSYTFVTDTHTVAANDSLAVSGYNNTIAVPGSASVATVYGYVYDLSGALDSGVIVSAIRYNQNAVDSVAGVFVSRIAVDTTDATGYFGLDLYRTSAFADTTHGFYLIYGREGGSQVFYLDSLTVPATGNLDLTSEI